MQPKGEKVKRKIRNNDHKMVTDWKKRKKFMLDMKDKKWELGKSGLKCSLFYNVKAHLTRICCLQLKLNPIELPFESVLGACIYHFTSHLWWIRWPTVTNTTKSTSSMFVMVVFFTYSKNTSTRSYQNLFFFSFFLSNVAANACKSYMYTW